MASLKDIMDTLAACLSAVGGYKNVYAFPTSPVSTPCVVIGYPTTIEYDRTYGGGFDGYTIPVFFLVGKNLTEAARDSLSDVLIGGHSIMTVLEDNSMTGTNNRVVGRSVETVSVAGIEYLSVTFSVEVLTEQA